MRLILDGLAMDGMISMAFVTRPYDTSTPELMVTTLKPCRKWRCTYEPDMLQLSRLVQSQRHHPASAALEAGQDTKRAVAMLRGR